MSTYKIEIPTDPKTIKKLKAGDTLFLTGKLFTARDKAHAKILETRLPFEDLDTLFHCGPIVKDGKLVSAGPTTSARMNQYTPDLLKQTSIRLIIGKGGMDETVMASLKGRAVYLAMTGGCGAVGAQKLKIMDNKWKELGMAESLWIMKAKEFGPLVVAMDSHGETLYGTNSK